MWRVKSLRRDRMATAEKKSLHRSLGPVQLTLLRHRRGDRHRQHRFVLTATAAQKAGPGMMMSFIIRYGLVCAVAAYAIRSWPPWCRWRARPTPIPTR